MVLGYGPRGDKDDGYLPPTLHRYNIVSPCFKIHRRSRSDGSKRQLWPYGVSIIVNSTPAISDADQLSILGILNIIFVPNAGHSEELYTSTTNTLAFLKTNLDDYRGQSYDSAANRSGAYTGLYAKIRMQTNLLNLYRPFPESSWI